MLAVGPTNDAQLSLIERHGICTFINCWHFAWGLRMNAKRISSYTLQPSSSMTHMQDRQVCMTRADHSKLACISRAPSTWQHWPLTVNHKVPVDAGCCPALAYMGQWKQRTRSPAGRPSNAAAASLGASVRLKTTCKKGCIRGS